MGLNICGIVVDSLPQFENIEQFDKRRLKTKFSKTKLKSLTPKDLSISFKDNKTLIFLDMIFYQNISEEAELTDLEKDLNAIFPNSKILIFVINETVDFTGYSLLENGVKLRTKAVATGDIFLDYGDIHSKEVEVYNRFYNSLKNSPESFKFLEEKYASLSESEKKKFYIRTRDNLLTKMNLESEFRYKDGSLDSYIIEEEFKKILDCDYFDTEQYEFIEFERRRLNFKKDSLREFLFLAMNELSKTSANMTLVK